MENNVTKRIGEIKTNTEDKLVRYFLNNKNPEGFKFWINLIDEILGFINISQGVQSNSIWGSWESDLLVLREMFVEKGMRKVEATGADGNPLYGYYGDFPIVACMAADPKVEISEAYQGICLLIVQKIFNEDSAVGLNNFCELLRRSKNISRKLYKSITKLPGYKGNLNAYKDSLNKIVDNLLENEDDCEKSSFLRSLFNLTEIKSKRLTIDYSESGVLKEFINEDVKIQIRQQSNISEDGEVDAPDNVVHVSDKDVDKEDEKHRPLERLVAEANKSRYWMRNVQQLSRFNSPCLSAIEKARLVRFIRSGLLSGDSERVAVSLVIGVGYLSPLDVDEALNVLNEADGSVISMNGEYFLETEEKVSEIKTGDVEQDNCVNLANIITLKMHDEIVSALFSLKNINGASVFERLNVNINSVAERVNKELDMLRDRDRYGITKRRINYALTAEIMISERNSVATFLLNNNSKNAKPVLSYYGVMSTAMINRIYRSSVNSLMRVA